MSPFSWLLLNLASIVVLGFYSMQEMACISFNRIRLQYYLSKNMKSAKWIDYLLQNPARLFGTTLISVNLAMFIGSECARQMYLGWGLSPDLAPLTQVAFVVIFGELAPMFAARKYPEHSAFLGAPIVYATSQVMKPLLWMIDLISYLIDSFSSKKRSSIHHTLNQEELQQILDFQEDEDNPSDESRVARNIFALREKEAHSVMKPIVSVPSLPVNATVVQLQHLLETSPFNFAPVYHREASHIVSIAYPRDLIRIPVNKRLREYLNPPWFITEKTKITRILIEFRKNNKSVAVVLNQQGESVGIITLEDLLIEIFGKLDLSQRKYSPLILMDRTFPADMTVGNFNDQFDVPLNANPGLTLAELMTEKLGHVPEVGETVYLSPFELTVKEAFLTELKQISVKTR